MAFHRKYVRLLELEPDIAVIAECASEALLNAKAPQFCPSSSTWVGDNQQKGLAIFTFNQFIADLCNEYRNDCPYIAPIRISGPLSFNLLAVWACHKKTNSYQARLGPLARALMTYRPFIEGAPCMVAGDFNDNVLWDKPNRLNKHSNNVAELETLGLTSAYHHVRGVDQGEEAEPTLYWRDRKSDGLRYHIDYCFVPRSWASNITNVQVGCFKTWVAEGLSDHVPLTVDLSLA